MSHPGAANADGARRIEILSATWERIQITLRMRPLDGRPLDPARIRLRGEGAVAGSGAGWALVAPARAKSDGDVLVARFNVMQGPGQEPLEPGRWTLVANANASAEHVDEDARILAVAGDLAALTQTIGDFPLARGRYTVRPAVAPDGAITLDVVLGPPEPLSDEVAAAAMNAGESPLRAMFVRVMRPLRRLRPGVFGLLLALFRATSRRTGRRILFTSDSRAELGGNLKIVHDRMLERGLDREYELRTLFRASITVRRGFRDRLRLPWLLARADTIVIDDFQPIIARLNARDTRIVQLWHAWGAFKTVGYSRVGKPGGLSPYSRVHKNYTVAIVSSESEVAFYAEAFGLAESQVIPTGIPRMDQFWDLARAQASRAATLAAYPAARDRTVYLFAPTFRGNGAKSAWYDLSLLDYPALHALCMETDAVCIIRMHPFVRTPLGIPEAYADRIIDGATSSIDINDVLFATDLLITDYSSVVFEFSTMDRPMLFFADDLDDYVASRDFYVRYQDFVPGRIVRTFADLLDAIRRKDYQVERLAAFRAEHLDHFDGQATDRVIDLIVAG